MNIKKISVANYRNLKTQSIALDKGLNVFIGQNAQGKTNLLESIYLCCLGKSPKSKDKELINWEKERAQVKAEFVSRYGQGSIEIILSKKENKRVLVNDISIARLGEMLGYVNAVYFSPDELKVIKLGPAERRSFVDIDLCQIDKSYFYALSRYNKILQQRNNLLKTTKDITKLKDMLSIWDVQLASEATRIVVKRKQFINQLKEIALVTHKKLTQNETLYIEYVSQLANVDDANIQSNYIKMLKANVDKDFFSGFTTIGVHRDDIKFIVDDIDIRTFGSQGQQRTCALSLKLAEVELFKMLTGEYPILLLDDVLSELDLSRQQKLLEFNKEIQIILTATHVDSSLLTDVMFFNLDSGVVNTYKAANTK